MAQYTTRITKQQVQKIPLLLRILGIDYKQDNIRRHEGLPIWQIIYMVSGSGEFFFGERRSIVCPGQIVLVPPYEDHRYQKTDENWVVHYIGFSGKISRELCYGIGFGKNYVFHLSHQEQFLSHLHALEHILSDDQPGKNLRCSKELYSLLTDLAFAAAPVPEKRYREELTLSDEIILYLEDHYAEDISMDTLSGYFHLAPEYLCVRFKDQTQQTIMKCLKNIRISRAKTLLMELPDERLSEIARLCGFHSLSYFGKVFREVTGVTPQGYRVGTYLQR